MNDISPSLSDQNRTPTAIDSPPPAPFRMLLVSVLSAAIGLVAGVVAFAIQADRPVMAARLRRFQDEHVREPGWFTSNGEELPAP